MKTTSAIDATSRHDGRRSAFFIKLLVLSVAVVALLVFSAIFGSLKVGVVQFLTGLFNGKDDLVNAIIDLRFPRILISALAGAALACSGCLLQACLKNPLADPGIIGVSGGAQFMDLLVGMLLPQLFFTKPLFSFLGGALGFGLVYVLSVRDGLKPLRIILTGIAINAMFLGLVSGLKYFTGQLMGAAPGLSLVNINMKGWQDVGFLLTYIPAGLVAAFLCARLCDLLLLEEKTVSGLGVRVGRIRFIVSIIAVFLASIASSIVGIISFLALIVPHLARTLVGNAHRRLLPFASLLGAFIFLFFDTLGRTVFAPVEVPASIFMMVIGGPVFILLFRKGDRIGYGK